MKMGGVVTSKKFKDLESRAREEFNKEKCKLLMEERVKQANFLKERMVEIDKAKDVLKKLEEQYQDLLERDLDSVSIEANNGMVFGDGINSIELTFDVISVGSLFDKIDKKISERENGYRRQR
jgi:hypothetical protein